MCCTGLRTLLARRVICTSLGLSSPCVVGLWCVCRQVGRMAGQFAKPRTENFEDRNGVQLPSYRGDNVNGDAFTPEARVPDPRRMVQAYSQAAATLNLLRAFATGGYAAMQRVTKWELDFMSHSDMADR